MHGTREQDLASPAQPVRARLRIGDVGVDPARREIAGPDAVARLEPRVLSVLLMLAEAQGEVVSREALLDGCWPGVLVGEDSLSRTIGAIRRALKDVGSQRLWVETIAKGGYRLAGSETALSEPRAEAIASLPTRRWVLGGLVAGAALAAAGAWLKGQRADPPLDPIRSLLLAASSTDRRPAIELARAQTVKRPADADSWGLLALTLVTLATQQYDLADSGRLQAEAIAAAHRALAIDPDQADAHAALAVSIPYFGRWQEAEARIRMVTTRAPGQVQARLYLSDLLADVGRLRDAEAEIEAVLPTARRTPAITTRLVALRGARGNEAGARQVMRTAEGWDPEHRTRVEIRLALWRGDLATASRLLDASLNDPGNGLFPRGVGAAGNRLVKAKLGGDAGAFGSAVEGALKVAQDRISAASILMQWLAVVGATDAAFLVADGLYRNRGPVRLPVRSPNGGSVIDYQRMRRAASLFEPGTASMRADGRFNGLVEDIGLADYWKASGSRPDMLT